MSAARLGPGERVTFGSLAIDVVRMDEALDLIEALVARREGGCVFTPNVDHVVKAERVPALREAYREVDLSVADGMPLVWASRLLGTPLPERISGSDLVLPLARRAARRGWRVYLLGGAGSDAAQAGEVLARLGVTLAGVEAPQVDLGAAGIAPNLKMAQRIRASGAELVLVALGAPKQEIWIHRHRAQLGGAVAVGVGASLAFLSGRVSRCPRWMARAGLEWLFRLGCEPRRLWRRYLVEDVAFVPILLRTWRGRRLARLEQIRPGGSSSSRGAPAARSPRPGGGPPGAEPSAATYVHGP